MASPSTLPTSRAFLASLISTLPTPADPSASANPLKHLTPKDRNPLLTLHVLFPHDFLPALDLLDRGLVTRFRIRGTSAPPDGPAPAAAPTTSASGGAQHVDDDGAEESAHATTAPVPARRPTVYYVRSAQQQRGGGRYGGGNSGRFHDATVGTGGYEVRLGAWNCSCPAFAFAAFPAESASDAEVEGDGGGGGGGGGGGERTAGREGGVGWVEGGGGLGGDESWFGGMSCGRENVPVCKHLLACALVERSELFKGFVEEREVSVEEAAGWAAGWGG